MGHLLKTFILALPLLVSSCVNPVFANESTSGITEDQAPAAPLPTLLTPPEPSDFRLQPEEVRKAIEFIYYFLPEGIYRGELGNGAACEIEVAPNHTRFKDLNIALKASDGPGSEKGVLRFRLNTYSALEIAMVERYKGRLSLETVTTGMDYKTGTKLLYTHLSLRFDKDENVTSIYLFEESRVGQALAHANCKILSYEPLPVSE